LVFRTLEGSFHAFVEVEAKEAARDCGVAEGANTRTMWESIWNQPGDATEAGEGPEPSGGK